MSANKGLLKRGESKMKKQLFALLTLLMLTSLVVLSACAPAAPSEPAPAEAPAAEEAAEEAVEEPAEEPMKIAFFVSDLSNVFHQGQATEAQKYAEEEYGAEVFIFDRRTWTR
jgi:ABC-type sugar transport system substrate-binding protein